MTQKKISVEELEKIAGAGAGAADAVYYDFIVKVYENSVYKDTIPCCGYDTVPARGLRNCLYQQFHAPIENIHIFLPDGREMNYSGTFGDNGLAEGMVLRADISL